MSIATDEAEKKYPAPTDADDPMYKYVEAIAGYPSAKRQGYIAGRTAEPTEAEIEAAAKAMYDELCGNIIHGYLDENGDPQMDEDPFRTVFINATIEALTAARKAVTE